jgi:hypothetical protein
VAAVAGKTVAAVAANDIDFGSGSVILMQGLARTPLAQGNQQEGARVNDEDCGTQQLHVRIISCSRLKKPAHLERPS